jgi:hypothetical protein
LRRPWLRSGIAALARPELRAVVSHLLRNITTGWRGSPVLSAPKSPSKKNTSGRASARRPGVVSGGVRPVSCARTRRASLIAQVKGRAAGHIPVGRSPPSCVRVFRVALRHAFA